MEYHCVHLNKTAVVRSADQGTTAFEWKHGCRIIQSNGMRQFAFKDHLKTLGYNVLEVDDWNHMMKSTQDPMNVPNNNFISTRVIRDKWDSRPEIY